MTEAIRFEIEGHGRPLVLLPGAACPASIFAPAAAYLRARHATHLGALAGFAGAPPIQPPVFPRYIAAGRAHVERHGPAVLIGHSLGGMLALEIALSLPAAVDALVLVESAPALGPLMHGTEDVEEHARRARAHRVTSSDADFVEGLVAALSGMFHDRAAFEWTVGHAGRSDPEVVGDAMAHVAVADLRPRLEELVRIPTLLIMGAWPGRTPTGRETQFRAQWGGKTNLYVTQIAGSGHFPMIEAPEAFARAVERFLDVV